MKKIIISIIVGVIALLGLCTTVKAEDGYYVGKTVDVTYAGYLQDPNLYCAEHGQRLNADHNWYTVVSNVNIVGTKSTDHAGGVIDSWHNAKFAYILSQDNGQVKAEGPVANSIWNYLGTWLANVGQNHAGLSTSFTNNVTGEANWLDTQSDNYANSLPETMEIKDNTNKDKIKVVAYQKGKKSYIRIGPFNWTFPGEMQSVTAKDQKGKNIDDILYSSFKGKEEQWHSVNEIKSGKNFYISIPMNTDISKITTITGHAKTTVKAVNIWFLQATNGAVQNLLAREPYEAPIDIETPFEYDISILGNLKVIKVNKDNQEVKLPGVGFYIQHKETGKYVKRNAKGKVTYVDKKKDATEFITNQKGEILIKKLVVGTYVAYETKNPNYGYEIITEGIENKVVVDKTSEYIITNKQIYVKLSGYVWVDKKDGKAPKRNDLYKTTDADGINDEYDILFNGVTVRLKDRTTGETIKETVTSKLDRYKDSVNDGNGEYLFMDVLIEKLKDYYIEFEYDGLTYTNVIPHIEVDRGSKAAESKQERNNFNANFSSVEGTGKNTGITKDANGNPKHELSYNIDEAKHEATLINNGQYRITANTDVPDPTYRAREHFTYGQEEVKYINLGLYEREQPDIEIVKDLNNVRVEINGYEHTYLYNQRFVNAGEYGGEGFNVGVKFGSKYKNMTYTRPIYKADYEYKNEANPGKNELEVYVIYEIAMKNSSANSLAIQVNSLVDYYDSNYQIKGVGTILNENGSVKDEISYTENSYNDKYNKAIINNNTRIEAQSQEAVKSIYVEFSLNREAVIKILNDKENLNNAVEINSYSVFKDNNIYAGIDRDSNPGNYVARRC